MTEDEFDAYRKNRYDDQVGWYDRKAGANQTIYCRMQWAIIILAAVTPILVVFVLDKDLPGWLQHLPAFTSAVVVILTAAMKTFKYQENWTNYRATCETLQREKHLHDANLGDYRAGSDEQKRSAFVERVESVLARENTTWLSTQKTERQDEGPQAEQSAG